jgi:hypothetical protein
MDCLMSSKHLHPLGISTVLITYRTPSIYTIQQLGLGITKAFSTHIRNATRSYITPNTPMNSSSQEHPDTDSFEIAGGFEASLPVKP